MLKSPLLKITLGLAVYMTGLGALRFEPWKHLPTKHGGRYSLDVGFLPVT